MGYQGVDLGSGIARFGDLIAQGYKDRQDLQAHDELLARQMAQQDLNRRIQVQQANQSTGIFDANELTKLGGTLVPGTPQAAPLPADFRIPDAPPPDVTPMVTPYEAKLSRAAAAAKAKDAQQVELAQMREDGKDGTTKGPNPQIREQIHAHMASVQTQHNIEQQQKILANPAANENDKSKAYALIKSLEAQKAQYDSMWRPTLPGITPPTGGLTPAPVTPPPTRTVSKKLYSPSRNQTKLVYSDGTEEVVSGQQ